MKEITCEELKALAEGSYVLIDIRDEGLCSYGMIPGAVNIPRGELEHSSELLKSAEDKKLIFYCEIGRLSRDLDDLLQGVDTDECYSLEGGYVGYVRAGINNETDIEEKKKKAEDSIKNSCPVFKKSFIKSFLHLLRRHAKHIS